jgi:hypothetical protein
MHGSRDTMDDPAGDGYERCGDGVSATARRGAGRGEPW